MTRRFVKPGILVAMLLGPALVGCSSHHRNEDFIPAEDSARSALEAHLTTWKQGNMEQEVPGTHPVVMAGDTLHKSKRPLKDFTILGPVPADTPRCYLVQLVLDAPYEERRERYIVIGIDPLWVMLYDDYEKLTHWCNEPPATNKAGNNSTPATK
jgi:hypothetical protein